MVAVLSRLMGNHLSERYPFCHQSDLIIFKSVITCSANLFFRKGIL